eukprot:gene37417-48940_t
MADKKRGIQKYHEDNKSSGSAAGSFKKFKQNDSSRDLFRFSSNNAQQWPLFLQRHQLSVMEAGISYILDEAEVQKIQTKTPRPTYRPYVPQNPGDEESKSDHEARMFEQSLDIKEWERNESIRTKKEEQLQIDAEKRISILFKITDNKINDSIDDFIKSECVGKSSIEKAQMVFEHIATVHGPHSNADAQNLRKMLWDLNPMDLKWRNYLTKFMHLYTTLKTMPQLDADNKPKIGPLPVALLQHPKPNLNGLSMQQQLDALNQWINDNEEEEQKIKEQYPLGGPVLTFQPTDAEVFTLLQQRVKNETSNHSIHGIYAQSLVETAWTWKDLYAKIKLIVDNDKSNNLQSTNGSTHPRNKTYGTSDSGTSPTSKINNQRGQSCRNCGGTHSTGTCPSAWCHTCEPCKKFDSAEARKAHFISTHGYNSNRGSSGRGSGGRTGGRGGNGKGRGGGRGSITERVEPSAPPTPADQTEEGIKSKKINRQVTIVERAKTSGSTCAALNYDYGY